MGTERPVRWAEIEDSPRAGHFSITTRFGEERLEAKVKALSSVLTGQYAEKAVGRYLATELAKGCLVAAARFSDHGSCLILVSRKLHVRSVTRLTSVWSRQSLTPRSKTEIIPEGDYHKPIYLSMALGDLPESIKIEGTAENRQPYEAIVSYVPRAQV